MATEPTTLYCTLQQIERRASAEAVELRTDDDAGAINACIVEATIEVNGYCERGYSIVALAASNWASQRCLDIAMWFLCSRRLEPVPTTVQQRYDRALKELDEVSKGTRQISDAPQRKAGIPRLSNQTVKRYPHPHIVTTRHNSTGKPSGYIPPDDRRDYDPEPS